MNADARSLGAKKGSACVPCTACGHGITGCVDTRMRTSGVTIRRRECKACGHRFTTHETVVREGVPLPKTIYAELTDLIHRIDELRHEIGR